jgi:hypothetical protein
MKRMIFIASLRHSGSTLLDLILGGHSRLIGLGEVARFLEQGVEEAGQAVCSCGNKMDQCLFWSKVASRLPSQDTLRFEEQYNLVLNTFDEVFGQDVIPVDSSKYLPYVELLYTRLKRDMKVLYLIKDVRSFTISQIDNVKRKRDRQRRNYLHIMPTYIFWRWYLTNKQMQRVFAEQNIPVFQIGYEELCLYPKFIIQKMCDFLGEQIEPSMLTLKDSNSHVLRGNRMRYQKEKAEILYDHRWFSRREWIIPAFLFPNIMKYNAKEVYKNNTEMIWEQ